MAGDRRKPKIKKVKFSEDGLERAERKARVQEAYTKLHSAYQDSHHALIKLVDFLDRPPFNEFIKGVTDRFIESDDSGRREGLRVVMGQYVQVLEAAKKVREQTGKVNEEFKRAVANWPPQQPGASKILAE